MRSCLWPQACRLGLLTAAVGLVLTTEAKLLYNDTHAVAGCTALPSKLDPIIGFSALYGQPNAYDTVWHDDEWAFKEYGPIANLTIYKAWYYDGEWHNPGELKGLAAWYGQPPDQSPTNDTLLFGARRPHVPQNFSLFRDEVLVQAELQWDNIMRWMNFTSNLGRSFSWGFENVTGAQTAVVQAPTAGSYIAAFRGYEGKPLPQSQGGFRKRYIAQIGFAWAQRPCKASARLATITTEASRSAINQATNKAEGKTQQQQQISTAIAKPTPGPNRSSVVPAMQPPTQQG